MSASQDLLTVLFQGASGSGKSQLISWHMTGKGQDACKTLEENYEFSEQFRGRREQVNFLDTSGDAECAEMMEEWVSKSNAQVLLINLEDSSSVGYLQDLLPAVAAPVRARVLVGNLPSGQEENRVITKAEGLQLASSLFTAPVCYVEVNTRSGEGVASVFAALMECAYGSAPSGAEEENKAPADKDAEIRLLKAQQAALEEKLAAITARFEALEAKQRIEEKAVATRFEAIEIQVSEASLTQRIEVMLLNSLKKIGWSRGASPPKTAEVETPPKVKVTKQPPAKLGRGQSVKQSLFASSASMP